MTKLEVFRDEELYIVERNGSYAVHGMLDGKRVRQAFRKSDIGRARTREKLCSKKRIALQ